MDTYRLTFYEPTNFTLPIAIYNTLIEDAFHFGYIKNNQANISGLLNRLIPCLATYRDDLHCQLLQANNNDEVLTSKIEENIYKIYFNKYDYCDDGTITVPFRVNKEYLQDFLEIYDNKLSKYNMDFTGFVRSLLIEYSSKRLNQREYFFFYKEMLHLKDAINNNALCHFYSKDEKLSFVPVSIEFFSETEQNLVVGIDLEKESAHILPLSSIKRIVYTESIIPITKDDCDFIYESLEQYYHETEQN